MCVGFQGYKSQPLVKLRGCCSDLLILLSPFSDWAVRRGERMRRLHLWLYFSLLQTASQREILKAFHGTLMIPLISSLLFHLSWAITTRGNTDADKHVTSVFRVRLSLQRQAANEIWCTNENALNLCTGRTTVQSTFKVV